MGDREYFTYVLLKSRAKAFNQHAAERLARSFSPDVQVRVEDTGEVLVQGQDALLSRYADLFRDNPEVAMDADSRHYRDHGCIVNDHEIITGAGRTRSEQWVTYELDANCHLIARVRLSRFP